MNIRATVRLNTVKVIHKRIKMQKSLTYSMVASSSSSACLCGGQSFLISSYLKEISVKEENYKVENLVEI